MMVARGDHGYDLTFGENVADRPIGNELVLVREVDGVDESGEVRRVRCVRLEDWRAEGLVIETGFQLILEEGPRLLLLLGHGVSPACADQRG